MKTKLTRRSFLHKGLACALGTGLAACSGSQRQPSVRPSSRQGLATATPPGMATRQAARPRATSETRVTAPSGSVSVAEELHEARYYVRLEDDVVQCQMCFRRCIVAEGERGFCRNKVNKGGRYFTLVYGRPSALQIDPIEKEPCFHMLPGGTIFCTGTASCNNRCMFCQNWHLSQRSFEEIDHTVISPESTVAMAKEMGCHAVSFTYNEPTVFYEHMFDVANLAKRQGMGALFHTNGGMNEEPLGAVLELMDAVTVDLKAFTPEFYRDVSSSELEPVLRTLQQVHQSEVHLEIVNLMVTTLNDNMDDVKAMCQWVCDTLSPEVPIHFTRFFPAYRLTSLSPTPLETLENAVQIADEVGLQYAYIGNWPGHKRNSTFCPECHEKIIARRHFSVSSLDVVKGKCRFCGHHIPGVWWDA